MTKSTSSTLIRAGLASAVIALSLTTFQAQSVVLAQGASEGKFEIIRSSADRIWRLNKETGEVSVCTMEGDRLICTTTEDAASPDAKSYEEIEKDRAEAEEERKQARAEERERQLSMLDRILEMVRELAGMAAENEAASENL